ncbi:MAG: sulfate adenylyltransferase subunit CysN [Vicinamibacterales bacterium]|nr:sulfate adenylyltransferase subunit CysN [Vicinamibacterales bacterium]
MDAARAYADTELLRFTTAGSVDDGKSTLIGRLLYDTKTIFDDQLAQITEASQRMGEDQVNLALLTDGLRAEREQGITIDVAYRYFATPRRKFIIADTPGHVQYTRNMVTGASTSDLAIVLVDARKGVLNQSRRHAFIASLLGIPHLIVAVNKMDLVGFAQEVYDAIVADFTAFAEKLTVPDVSFVPVSARDGDNVVTPSARMPWYLGGPLLHLLETVKVSGRRNTIDFRFPVQSVIRPHQGFRGYAGTVASGAIRPGAEVVALPAGLTTRVRSIETFDGPRDEARAGDAVVLTFEDEIDISRGDMVVPTKNLPTTTRRVDAYVCWMDQAPMAPGATFVLQQTTRQTQAVVDRIEYRVDVDTLHRAEAERLGLNEIGRIALTTSAPLFVDSYRVNAATGSFILIDPHTHVTVGAGMVRGEVRDVPGRAGPGAPGEPAATGPVSANVVWEGWNIGREAREARNRHRAAVIWLTGLPGAGKTPIARQVEGLLFARGCQTMLLDGDQIRHGLCGDLGFAPADRTENIRRVGEVARLFFEQGAIVLCAFVSPYRQDRDRARALVPDGRFLEVLVTAGDEVRRARDPKGHYARADAGRVADFTGVSAPYEASVAPELVIDTDGAGIEACAYRIIEALVARGLVPAAQGDDRGAPS